MVSVKPVTSQNPRWTLELIFKSSGIKRTVTGLLLLAYFALALYVGVPLIVTNTLIIQIKSFKEVMDIGFRIKKLPHVPFFKELLWYFIALSNYFLLIENFQQYLTVFINKYYFLHLLTSYHRFISFSLYLMGLVLFVVMLKEDIILQQFSLLFWTHFLIIILTVQSYLFIQNVYEGLIWLMVPFLQIILNDTFAYLVGKNFGKTFLIALSPNKTVEGFIGGGLCTVLLGTVFAYIFSHFNYLICPIKYREVNNLIVTITNCTPSSFFNPTRYQIGNTGLYLNLYPFIRHAVYTGLFASILAPFGGFFASGFKRAASIKDFGNIIPGHGGFMDRFDCCFFMGTFVNFYIWTFVKSLSTEKVFQRAMKLPDEKQLEFYFLLKKSLSDEVMNSITL